MTKKLSVGLISNVNLDLVKQGIEKRFNCISPAGYGQWIQETFALSEELSTSNLEALFLILDGNEITSSCNSTQEVFKKIVEYIEHVKRLARNNPTIPIFVSNIDLSNTSTGPGDSFPANKDLANKWESYLQETIEEYINIHRFDLQNLIHEMGRNAFYSEKLWYLGSIPYSVNANKVVAAEIIKIVSNRSKPRKKVLVVDLDNTLWGGVLGEDGPEGILIGGSKEGLLFQDVQKRIFELSQTGILLAVSSKNDKTDVENVLQNHPNMILRKSSFVSIQAGWDSKTEHILRIAKDLNLGLDSIVFLDDNPVERETVGKSLPDVVVLDFPQELELLPKIIVNASRDLFYSERITLEDKNKLVQYRNEQNRANLEQSAISIDDYLKTLEVVISLEFLNSQNIERVAQLINKTNQFNVLTERFSIEDLLKYNQHDHNYVFAAKVSDRFGDSGLVLVIMISVEAKVAKIDNFLMSCRVMGRQIEHHVVAAVVNLLKGLGVNTLQATYKYSERNEPVKELFDRLGFDIKSEEKSYKSYSLNISTEFNINKIHTIEWSEN